MKKNFWMQPLLGAAICGLLLGSLPARARAEKPVRPETHHRALEAQQRQVQLPVLIGKANNPILQLTLTVPEQGSEEVTTFEFSTAGTTRLPDVQKASLFYCGTESQLDKSLAKGTAKLFGVADKIGPKITIRGQLALAPGKHTFWLAYDLNERADLMNFVDASCLKVSTKTGTVSPPSQGTAIRQRIGYALRKHMDDNVHTYRIPGLTTTKNGTLLAVYDARRELSRDLQGDIDIVVNRSTDGGKTWEPMTIALDMGTWGGLPQKFNGVSDACILVDDRTNTVYVAGLWMHGVINDEGKWLEGLNENSREWNHQWRTKGSQPGFDVRQTSQFLITKSTDDGKTWSEPVNITRMIKEEDWWLLAPGPGKGIVLKDGTLVFPTQGRDKTGEAFSNITYSKDGGKTWKTSRKAVEASTNEDQAVELSDGSIMLNMRANRNRTDTSATNGRAVAVTRDLGETWQEHPTSFGALPEPNCMASIHRHDYVEGGKKKSVLLFSNPNSKTKRDHITLKLSFDDGMTWPKSHWILLDEFNGRGYSCITSVDENTIGIVYESSQADMVFQKISLSELLRAKK